MDASLETSTRFGRPTEILRSPILWEVISWLVLSLSYIILISMGEENGVGYFQQPENSLFLIMLSGGLFHAALFWMNAFYAIPRFLAEHKWRQYVAIISGLLFTCVALKTVSEKLIIELAEPSLIDLSWQALALENLYIPPLVLIISALYKFTRDWIIHLEELRSLEFQKAALVEELIEARNEISMLNVTNPISGFLQIKVGSDEMQLPFCTIKYVKSAGNYVDIVTQERSFFTYGAIKDIVEALPRQQFARIHRSYLVALDHIQTVRGNSVCLVDSKLPIGAAFKEQFMEIWKQRASAIG